jgi:hypothetical protein
MNQYLLADENREAISAHNDQLVETHIKIVGKASVTTHDFNRQEEYRRLDSVVAGDDIDSQTVRSIAVQLYGTDDDEVVGRVRRNLKFGSTFQKRLRNGTAVVARQDGTLRITRTADEYGSLVTESLAREADRLKTAVTRGAKRMDLQAAAAVEKVPELAPAMAELRTDMQVSLSAVFTRQLERLSGE